MCNSNPDDNKAFIEHWQRAGQKLDEIRRAELRDYRHEEHLAIIDALLEIGFEHGTFRPTSGLVEQQRLFHKARQ